jgi:hypothetical protein
MFSPPHHSASFSGWINVLYMTAIHTGLFFPGIRPGDIRVRLGRINRLIVYFGLAFFFALTHAVFTFSFTLSGTVSFKYFSHWKTSSLYRFFLPVQFESIGISILGTRMNTDFQDIKSYNNQISVESVNIYVLI